jgi:hypothetical protein
MYRRNLSFNSNIWELALQGDFNFFKFLPGEPGYSFYSVTSPLVLALLTMIPFAYWAGKNIICAA